MSNRSRELISIYWHRGLETGKIVLVGIQKLRWLIDSTWSSDTGKYLLPKCQHMYRWHGSMHAGLCAHWDSGTSTLTHTHGIKGNAQYSSLNPPPVRLLDPLPIHMCKAQSPLWGTDWHMGGSVWDGVCWLTHGGLGWIIIAIETISGRVSDCPRFWNQGARKCSCWKPLSAMHACMYVCGCTRTQP